jgi:hypothetical protein
LSGRCAPSPGGFRLHLPYPAYSLNCRRHLRRGRACRLQRAGRGRDWAAVQLESGALWSAPAAWPVSRGPPNLPSCTQLPIPAQPVSYSAAARYGSGPRMSRSKGPAARGTQADRETLPAKPMRVDLSTPDGVPADEVWTATRSPGAHQIQISICLQAGKSGTSGRVAAVGTALPRLLDGG